MNNSRLIRDIEPIDIAYTNLLKEDGDIIDLIIEEPLRKACKILRDKGILTLMSSANKNNIFGKEEKIEKEDIPKDNYMYMNRPSFKEAGKGYAWIMIDFVSLSTENRKMLIRLEEEQDISANLTGGQMIWFVFNEFDDIFSLFGIRSKRENETIEDEELMKKFEEKMISLSYTNRIKTNRSVFIRMPIDETTTVVECEKFFEVIAQRFEQQELCQNKQLKSGMDGR